MPDTFAYIVLFGWPLAVVVLFRLMPVPKAIVISIVAGYLLLPTRASFDLPLLPEYERALAASLPALVMAFLMTRPARPARRGEALLPVYARPGWLPQQPLLKFCVVVIVVSPFLTVLMNGDALRYGDPAHPRLPVRYLPGLSPYDGAAAVLGTLMALLPFFLARKYLARPREQMMLLGVLFVAALAYSLPTLWEIRMSPQLNRQIYGFFPHDWDQHLRGGGFRPIVFLEHGLRLGIFFALATIAAVGYVRGSKINRKILVPAVLWLLCTLVLCKTLGALLIALLLLPIAVFLGARTQMFVAAILAATVLTFPMTRATGLFPIDTVAGAVSSFSSSQRTQSLAYRFENEDFMLEKVAERPFFGWGGWGRARYYDDLGRDLSSALDGTWIIEFGERGWVGYTAMFGLLTLPIVLLALKRRAEEVALASAALALALVANLIDLIPNSALTPLTWLMAGSLAGRLETRTAAEDEAEPAAVSDPRHPLSLYRRPLGAAGPGLRPAVRQADAVEPAGTTTAVDAKEDVRSEARHLPYRRRLNAAASSKREALSQPLRRYRPEEGPS